MKPAPKATKCSITVSPRAAWRITAAAPSRLPPAAISAYHRALDTTRALLLRALHQVLAGVARRVLEHKAEQLLQRLAHVGAGPHAGGDQVVAFHREVGERERVVRRADGREHLGARGVGRLA